MVIIIETYPSLVVGLRFSWHIIKIGAFHNVIIEVKPGTVVFGKWHGKIDTDK